MDTGNIRHNSQNEYRQDRKLKIKLATRTPQKTGGDLRCSRMLSSSWFHFKKYVIAKFVISLCDGINRTDVFYTPEIKESASI